MHSLSSRTQLLEMGWALSHSRTAQGEKCWVGIISALDLSPVSGWVAPLQLQVAGGTVLNVVCGLLGVCGGAPGGLKWKECGKSTTNTMFEHKMVPRCALYQAILVEGP
ncbi:hypothetical protein ATANTOWER_022062 [Ataeniobius toweri]|uniref:Uncharacterized protein n=1 Tax=Ataeniobius toweri TaxID=208326 RepID=A0ABU7B8Y0_9TELE|nr:hypothetical protein [Ataeniobius toweri]